QAAANVSPPAVFSPIPATFKDASNATEANLSEGLVLCVEGDQNAVLAGRKLEAVLGPPTLVVESGGVWSDPATGGVQNKAHIYWRLTRAATGEDLERLKRARRLATAFVGGDPSNITCVHPLRWPGSWHRKG